MGIQLEKFEGLLVSHKVVAGKIYDFTVNVGKEVLLRVSVLVPLPHTKEGPKVMKVSEEFKVETA